MSEKLILWADKRFYSPWVLTVWTALKEKEVPFDVHTINLRSNEPKVAHYKSNVRNGKIPSLQHGSLWLGESSAIVEYLEELYAPPKYPALLAQDKPSRARDRELLSWIRTDFTDLRTAMPFEGLYEQNQGTPANDKVKEQIARLCEVATERSSRAREQGPTIADFDLAFMLQRPLHYGYDLGKYPKAKDFADYLWSRPSVQSWYKHERPLDL